MHAALNSQVEKVGKFTLKLVEELRQELQRLEAQVDARHGDDDRRDERLLKVTDWRVHCAIHA